jgi:hypothetical protein
MTRCSRCSTGNSVVASGTKVPGTSRTSGAYAEDPSLTKGMGFFLKDNGEWGVGNISEKVVRESEFSGYLTIYGYKSAVFEMPDKSQYAQKVTEPDKSLEIVSFQMAMRILDRSGSF